MVLNNRFSRSGFFQTSDGSGHRIFYEDYGPKDAPAFVMVHGNAGYTFDPSKIGMWDLDRQRVIVIHMRGIGLSAPQGSVTNNLYPDLAEDIKTLRTHLELKKVTLFGWSGGTAVSLLYAEKYPDSVAGLILYGTYLGTQNEINTYYKRVKQKYPDGWARFCNAYGSSDAPTALKRHHRTLLERPYAEKLDAVIQYALIFEPTSVSVSDMEARLSPLDWEKAVKDRMIFAYMMEKQYGLSPDQIRNDLDKIRNIPVLFVNGSEDHITPPAIAADLATQLPQARRITIAGADHDVQNPAVQKRLFRLLKDFPLPQGGETGPTLASPEAG